MSQRLLFAIGVVAIVASLAMAATAIATSPSGFSMSGLFGSSSVSPVSMDKAQRSVQSFVRVPARA